MTTCPLTGQKINLVKPNPLKEVYYYETYMTGKVRITDVALDAAEGLSTREKELLTGICRNKTIKNEEPDVITASFLQTLNNQNIPYEFEERGIYFLQYLYDNGGKEHKSHNLNSDSDSPITYSSKEEFERIITFLKNENWITYENKISTKQCVFYKELMITKSGIQKIEDKTKINKKNNEELKELNELIDKIENKLRNIIVEVLIRETGKADFESLLTGDVKSQVRRRIEQHIEKHPNLLFDNFKPLNKSIQFCDIEHLKKIIIKEEFWEWFKLIFQDKSKVEKYFNQFSEIRHVVKHNREMTNLILHEGNAAIEWFEMTKFI